MPGLFCFPSCLLDYLDQVDLREKADLQEKEAQQLLDSGKSTAVTTRHLLGTLAKPDQNPLFYAGGIEILTELMEDCKPETCGLMNVVGVKGRSLEVRDSLHSRNIDRRPTIT